MSIASIVAWLWMAAQSGNVSVKVNTDGDSVYRVPVMQDAQPINPTAPAEHVIEIRTKQTCHTISKTERNMHIGCGPTREIWIDGQRWGILKESESR